VVEAGVEAQVRCSAKGCRAAASWALLWNNPKLHTPERRKTWLACDDHRRSLGDFLRARGFLREERPFPPDAVRADRRGTVEPSHGDADAGNDNRV